MSDEQDDMSRLDRMERVRESLAAHHAEFDTRYKLLMKRLSPGQDPAGPRGEEPSE